MKIPTRSIPLIFTRENRKAIWQDVIKFETRRLPRPVDGNVPLEISIGTRCPYGDPMTEKVQYWVKEPMVFVHPPRPVISDGETRVEYLDDQNRRWVGLSFGDCWKVEARKSSWDTPTTSMFMLKSCARIWLPGQRTWSERLGDISDHSAVMEGIAIDPAVNTNAVAQRLQAQQERVWRDYREPDKYGLGAKASYRSLWETIHGRDSWNDDQEVWCVRWATIRGRQAE